MRNMYHAVFSLDEFSFNLSFEDSLCSKPTFGKVIIDQGSKRSSDLFVSACSRTSVYSGTAFFIHSGDKKGFAVVKGFLSHLL